MDDIFGKMQELLSDPESMKQISELAQMLKQETTDAGSEPAPSAGEAPEEKEVSQKKADGFPFDPSMLLQFGQILNASQKSDKNTELLLALRPHLRQERQEKVDRAVKLLRLLAVWNLLKDNGLLQNFLS